MNVALVSLDQIWQDKIANLRQCELYVTKATGNGADLIVFPEMTLTGFSMNASLIKEKREDSNSIKRFQRMAKNTTLP